MLERSIYDEGLSELCYEALSLLVMLKLDEIGTGLRGCSKLHSQYDDHIGGFWKLDMKSSRGVLKMP